jgi:outer membrane protein TolC
MGERKGSRPTRRAIPAEPFRAERLTDRVTLDRPILAFVALLSASPVLARAAPLSIDDAVRAAWSRHEGLRASARAADAARADAERASWSRLPTISLSGRAVRTDEPMMAFGMKLDQGRITQADFDPARLNEPAAIAGLGAGAALQVPLFMGGRLTAGAHAADAMARAEEATHARRREELAAGVVEVYFATQAAEEGLRYAEELVAQAAETERFVRERAAKGLALDADVARAAAFRAQAQAERASADQRRATARSGLALLAGPEAAEAELVSPVAAPPSAGPPEPPRERPDVAAARLQEEAAREGVTVARGSLLPAIFAQASAETLHTTDLSQGQSWTTLGVLLRWDLSLADGKALAAARARAEAARSAAAWKTREAAREVDEARRAIEASDLRVRAAEEAVLAASEARALRDARHRQGLLPLTDVLDAQAALAGARALLLASRVDARVARARLALAVAQPIEGITP